MIVRRGVSLFPGNNAGDILTWDGTRWVSSPPNFPASPGDTIVYVLQNGVIVPAATSYGVLGNKVFLSAQQNGYNATLQVLGGVHAAVGTISAGVFSPATYAESIAHANYATTAAANSDAAIRFVSGNQRFWRGDAIGLGGFQMRMQWTPVVTNAGAKAFFGMRNTVGSPFLVAVNPGAMLNCVGLGYDAGDANLQIIHNDAVGAATKVDTGLNKTTLINTTLDLWIECLPFHTQMTVTLFSVNASGRTAMLQGLLVTDLPVNNDFLDPLWDLNAAASGAVSSHRFHRIYCEPR